MLKESDYIHDEYQFGERRGHDGRKLYPFNDYEIVHPADYHKMGEVDGYMRNESHDSKELLEGHDGWEEHELSSERIYNDSHDYESYESSIWHYGLKKHEVSSDSMYSDSSDNDSIECSQGNYGWEEHRVSSEMCNELLDYDYAERLKGHYGWEDKRFSSERVYNDMHDYDSYERLQGHYGLKEHRLPSEILLEKRALPERRPHRRNYTTDHIDKLDLRHHIIKKKLDRGLNSEASHDRAYEDHYDFKYWTPRRDSSSARESAINKRLGRRTEDPGRERRVKCEQELGGSTYQERIQYPRAGGAERIDESDLRYHVLKQDVGNGLRSVVSHDRADESHDNWSHQTPRKDLFLFNTHESMLGSEMQGTIKVPERSTYSDYITDRSRHRGRGSAERPHGRPRNGINKIVDNDLDSEGRTTRDLHLRSEAEDSDDYKKKIGAISG
ncbi:hypothetical protein POM88_027313 [Heracleum sosnowskyi]|uniref:Uncharacterized protein n=1 Tax=Heracleum sosnowskyi TaxID=360622 RepID=A0AAD8MPZ9_9APIA|nr:hypothetical protein POM88_027313 [Heracleum sosnowskyi]